ncbi:Lipoprotein signal peptidase [Burkholderiales bacterium]|nr:Lipoprotein signal peptidase [Burkholderiales bacterium]
MAIPRRGALAAATPWLALAALVLIADQVTKAQVQQALEPGHALAVTGYFNLVLAYNRGAAFSLLNEASGWAGQLFTVIGIGASAFLVWLLVGHGQRRLFAAALGLILGGALGNVVDRVRYGHVIDFLDFHWAWLAALFPGGHFPAFNVADSAICCGAALLILDEVLRTRLRVLPGP